MLDNKSVVINLIISSFTGGGEESLPALFIKNQLLFIRIRFIGQVCVHIRGF